MLHSFVCKWNEITTTDFIFMTNLYNQEFSLQIGWNTTRSLYQFRYVHVTQKFFIKQHISFNLNWWMKLSPLFFKRVSLYFHIASIALINTVTPSPDANYMCCSINNIRVSFTLMKLAPTTISTYSSFDERAKVARFPFYLLIWEHSDQKDTENYDQRCCRCHFQSRDKDKVNLSVKYFD